MKRRHRWIGFGMCLLLLWAPGCSLRGLMVDQSAAVMEAGAEAFEQETDLRLLAAAFPAHIKQAEGLFAARPENPSLPVLISRLYAAYALSVLEPEVESARLLGSGHPPGAADALERYYRRGAESALRALEIRHDDVRRSLQQVADADAFFARTTRQDVPALFWYGFNLGAWVDLNRRSVRSVAQAHRVRRCMERVLELQPDYRDGAAHLVLAVYFAARPPMMGGDLQRAEEHLERLREIAGPDFLLADVYHARYVLVRRGDRDAFEAELAGVIRREKTAAAYPLLNRVAAEKAGIYRKAADRFFD